MELRAQFREIIKSDYLEEENLVPGVYALRAYDSIMAISHAVTKLGSDENTTAKTLLEGILSSKFLGLSGNISFMELRAQFREIIKSDYLEENLVPGVYALRAYDSIMAISHAVTKLGSDENTTAKTLLEGILSSKFLGLSGNISFRDGILLDSSNLRIINVVGKVYKDLGFWSSKVLKKNYYLPYEFIPFYGTYDDLVLSVSNETFDDAVGDVTIIESRAKLVEFTQPFAESGLSMMVQYKHKPTRAWLFLKPFSPTWHDYVVHFFKSVLRTQNAGNER
ncbi:hypothetical protein POM88_028448 [Heracleum sosnowskyi]|uniref:Receptor ligand binding region domain-containing protein n=1 Tax=Heracleum sosnowskyi TaxID=360622 RepID=A0AAD8ME28_9APIA|nr:hypothetical protein POM88_028448 [Heracleum sosnowskyi]